MKTSFIFALLPIAISFISLWINLIHGNIKNKTDVIDNLSQELNNKEPTPYIIQACVSRIHNSRPIPFKILNKLLHYNNALEIIQLVSAGRKILDIIEFSENGNSITVGYTNAFNTVASRFFCMVVCFGSLLLCYSASVYIMLQIMISIKGMSSLGAEEIAEIGELTLKAIVLIFFMFMTFIFSWQLIIILYSRKRITKIQKLINDGYVSHNRNFRQRRGIS